MEKKLAKSSPETLGLDSAAVAKGEKKKDKKDRNKKSSTTKRILLASIAAYLESNGLSKSLSTLRSEAQLETDDTEETFPNLEDVFRKFLEWSSGHEENSINWRNGQDTKDGGIARKDGDAKEHDVPGQILKKKRKKNTGNDGGTKGGTGHENGCDEHDDIVEKIPSKTLDGFQVTSKERKKKVSPPESCPVKIGDVSVDKNLMELKKSEDKTDLKNSISDDKHSDDNNVLDDSCAETTHKKRKKKVNSDSLGEDTGKNQLEAPCETVKNVDHRSLVHDSHVNDKDTKKKKHKMISDPSGEFSEGGSNGKFKDKVVEKVGELESLVNNSSTELLYSNLKHKDEKKKKTKSTSDSLNDNADQLNLEASDKVNDESSRNLNSVVVENNTHLLGKKDGKGKRKKKMDESTLECPNGMSYDQLDKEISHDGYIKSTVDQKIEESLKVSDAGTENIIISGEKVDGVGRKNSRKRKRLSSEETGSEMNKVAATKESEQVILEAPEDIKQTKALQNDTSLQVNEFQDLNKKRKIEKSNEDGSLANHNENSSTKVMQEEITRLQLANGHISKNEREERTASKGMKKEKHSAEPKTFNAFQRVKVDAVEFSDKRLKDNSYWAKSGAETGYGAKAQEILGQVRGRDFRHEKTKKKRGTYKGGEIDLQSHSIKFNYSDDE